MSASLIHDIAPIGSILAWSDGTPRPPERHRKKLAAWKTRNGQGRLVAKQGKRVRGSFVSRPDFRVHEGDYGSNATIVLRVFRTFSIDSDLTFKVIERPAVGAVRIFDRPGESAELVHVAVDRQAAEAWLGRHGYLGAVLEEVTADEVGADVVEGRAAA